MYLVRLLEALLYLAGQRDPARTPPGCQGRLARRTFIKISTVAYLSKSGGGAQEGGDGGCEEAPGCSLEVLSRREPFNAKGGR